MSGYTGRCACGGVRYAMLGEPVFQNHCHCRDCQRRSGTGHGSYLTFAGRGDATITGAAREWHVAGDGGGEKIHAFRPVRGTPVYLTFAAMPDLTAVHAGSLDDPARFRPEAVTSGIRRLA